MKNTFLLLIAFGAFTQLKSQTMNPYLKSQIKTLIKEEDQISFERKVQLQELASTISTQIAEQGSSRVTFVCTHNSRRSQLSELWMRMAATYYDLDQISAYSGGTEATAFNQRMVDAVVRFGFYILRGKDADNPVYISKVSENDPNDVTMFSKKFDDSFNPQKDFVAVMVCSDADRNCPFVPGAYDRVSLPYKDPKAFDDSDHEKEAYDDKVREIGREILYLTKMIMIDQ